MKKSIVQAVRNLTDEALWCRTEGHNFKWLTDTTTVSPRGRLIEVERHLQCERCGVPAKRVIDAVTWTPGRRKISQYPTGYLIRGQGRVPKGAIYREQFERSA